MLVVIPAVPGDPSTATASVQYCLCLVKLSVGEIVVQTCTIISAAAIDTDYFRALTYVLYSKYDRLLLVKNVL